MTTLAENGVATVGVETRNAAGQFATSRDRFVLLRAVPEVARLAARRSGVPNRDPSSVSEREWNAARSLVEPAYGPLPQANEVCRQLADYYGRSWPWRDLLAVCLDDARDAKKTYEERLSEPDREIINEHVSFALNWIARHLNKPTLLPRDYEEARGQLLSENNARAFAAKLRLPSRGQIETASGGSWDRALEIASLSPRKPDEGEDTSASAHRELGEVPTTQALVGFYDAHHRFPDDELELSNYIAARGHRTRSDQNTSWTEQLKSATAAIHALDLTAANSPHDRGAATTGAKQGRYSHVQVVAAVREFVLASDKAATNKRWREFCRGRDGVPSLNVIVAHGGLKLLLVEASHSDWKERAGLWDAAPPVSRPTRPKGRPTSGKRCTIVEAIRAAGEIGVRDLNERTGLPLDQIRYYLRKLKEERAIEPTKAMNAKNQTYRIQRSQKGVEQ
jgi:hypothetical protein